MSSNFVEEKLNKDIGVAVLLKEKLGYADLETDFDVVLESISQLKVTFNVKIGYDYLQKAKEVFVNAQYEQEKPAMPGFMVGRVPMMVKIKHYEEKFAKGHYAEQVKDLADFILIGEIRRSVDMIKMHYKILDTLDAKFQLSATKPTAEEGYSFKFTVEVLPEIPTIDLKTINVDKYDVKIAKSDVTEAMTNWANTSTRGVALTEPRPAMLGDTIILDLVIPGKTEGINDFPVVIGAGTLNPEFEAQLIDKNIGDKFSYHFSLPKNFSDASVAGRSFNVQVIVKNILATENYKIDEEMARVFGVSSVASCEEKFLQTLETNADKIALLASKKILMKELGKSYDILIPEEIFDKSMLSRLDRLAKEIGTNLHYPMPEEEKAEIKDKMIATFGYDYDQWYANEETAARADLKASLMLLKYGRDKKIVVHHEDVEREIAQQSHTFKGGLKEAVDFFEKDKNAKQKIADEILDRKIVTEILRDVTVNVKTISLAELRALLSIDNVNPKLTVKDAESAKPKKTKKTEKVEEQTTDSKE